ncbi:hypothetical protein RB195_019384 [Necator americanus]|uniref:C3H1-type domain-containing protein n=1 Tax=Necator americanus TaxID=51031 RepID=A0ABR1CGR1_NECAM
MLWRSAGLVALALQVAFADELSCDFRRPCCWHSLNEEAKWQVRSGRSININEFRRTFLVGRSRLPPVGNYLLQNGNQVLAAFGSCAFCSADGKVTVQYRHWQSPTARLKLCWRRWYYPLQEENCYAAEPSRQSQIISQLLTVPSGKDIQVLFVVERSKGSVNAIVMLDRVLVTVTKCSSNGQKKVELVSRTARIVVPASVQTTEKRYGTESRAAVLGSNVHKPTSRKMDLSQLALTDERVKAKLLEKESERQSPRQWLAVSVSKPKELKKQSGEVSASKESNTHASSRSNEEMASTKEVSSPQALLTSLPVKKIPSKLPKRFIPDSHHLKPPSSGTRAMPPPSPPAKTENYNPLAELLGQELVDFLDPNYVSKDDDEAEPDYDEESSIPKQTHIPTSPTQVQLPPPLSVFHRPLSLAPPQPCNTVGGCLFDRSMCSYVHPGHVPYANRFTRLKVGLSNFIRARVPPGGSSVLETDTNMMESHTVFFDALEWQPGTRLIGCCADITGAQKCPFATPSEAGVLLWQSGSFDCPAYTVKIRFICENFGIELGECGIDSIRLHRLSDTFLLEPCQKNILSSL